MTDVKPPYQGDDEDYSPPPPWHQRISSNVPALVAFIILIIIVMWGLVHLLVLIQPWFATLVEKPKVTQSAPSSTTTTLPRPALSTSPVSSIHTTRPAAPHNNPVRTAPAASPADLSVHILAVGVIDPSTGAFVNRAPSSPADVAAVQFDISNEGGSSTGAWYFDAQLPTTYPGYAYTSPRQEPLAPGDHIINTLRFSPVIPGGGVFNVIVDPQGMVNESSEANNTATVFIPMPSYY